ELKALGEPDGSSALIGTIAADRWTVVKQIEVQKVIEIIRQPYRKNMPVKQIEPFGVIQSELNRWTLPMKRRKTGNIFFHLVAEEPPHLAALSGSSVPTNHAEIAVLIGVVQQARGHHGGGYAKPGKDAGRADDVSNERFPRRLKPSAKQLHGKLVGVAN